MKAGAAMNSTTPRTTPAIIDSVISALLSAFTLPSSAADARSAFAA